MNERMPSSLYESSSSFEIHEGESSESYDVAVSNIGRECVDDETLDQTPEGSIDVEEWLIKQRALSENCGRSADYERRGNPAQVPSITKISYFQATHDTTDCSTKAGVRSVNLHPPIHYNNSNESLQHRNDEHSPTSEAISSAVTADVEFAFTSSRQGQDFIVEVSALVNNLDQPIVVAAKRVKDPNNRRLATLICLVVAAVIVIVTAAVLKLNRNEANGTNDQPTPDVSREPNISSTTFPASTSINTTIGDSWASLGKSLTIVGLLSESGKIYLNTLQRTDTYFTVVSFNIDLLPAEMNWTLLARYSDPLWSGHTLSLLMHRIIEGQVLTYADITDGLVVQSMAGYPVTFFKQPNFTIDGTEVLKRDITYTNAVEQELAHVPHSLVPWMYRTDYDVLLEVNEQRGGDLSDFIALLNSSNLTELLTMEVGDRPITVFIPTNEALSTIVTGDTLDTDSRTHQLLLNHLVVGNFVINSWLRIPTGKRISDTDLQLTTQAGNVLDVLVGDKDVTINGNIRIIQKDVLSFTGVLHIIDLPLVT